MSKKWRDQRLVTISKRWAWALFTDLYLSTYQHQKQPLLNLVTETQDLLHPLQNSDPNKKIHPETIVHSVYPSNSLRNKDNVVNSCQDSSCTGPFVE